MPLCRPAGALPAAGWILCQGLPWWLPARPAAATAGGAAVATSDDPRRRRRNRRSTNTVKPTQTKAAPKIRTSDGIAFMIKLRRGTASMPYSSFCRPTTWTGPAGAQTVGQNLADPAPKSQPWHPRRPQT
jgi:hypothetical protein